MRHASLNTRSDPSESRRLASGFGLERESSARRPNRHRTIALLFFAWLSLVSDGGCIAQSSAIIQTLPPGFEQVSGNSASLAGPSSQTAGRWQWHYDASLFLARGPILITSVSVRPIQGPNSWPAVQFQNLRLRLGPASTNYRPENRSPLFESNFASSGLARSGPWNFPAIPPPRAPAIAWVSMGVTTPIAYDPSSGLDLIVELSLCDANPNAVLPPLDTATGVPGALFANAYSATGSCTAAIANQFGDEEVPILRIEFIPLGGFEYELNKGRSSLTIDRQSADPYRPAIGERCIGTPLLAELRSSFAGTAYELAVALAVPAPLSAGSITTTSGQILHLPLGGAPFFFLGAAFVNDIAPRFDVLSLPTNGQDLTLVTPASPFSLQMIVPDPSHPDLVVLSQASAIRGVNTPFPVELTLGDDDATTVQLGAAPGCGPGYFQFYGITWHEMHVSSNGRITFAYADALDDVSTLNARGGPPMIGGWTDLDPTASGGVLVRAPQPDRIRIRWSQIVSPRGSTFAPNTLEVDLIPATGEIEIRWVDFGGPGRPSQPYWLGISPGSIGGASDPGPLVFGIPGAFGFGYAPTDMLYQIGSLIRAPSTTGIGVRFVPLPDGSYGWLGL